MGCSASKNQVNDDNKPTSRQTGTKSEKTEMRSRQTENGNKSKSSSGFPTPDSLTLAQIDYHKSNTKKKKPNNAKNGNLVEVPEPFPPPTMKDDVFNEANYKKVDVNARKAPLQLAAKSYSALVAYLTRPAENDIGKVRSFYVWIASQKLQKVAEFTGKKLPAADTPLYTLLVTLVKQWGNGYSELFSKLCSEAKIPCQTVKGLVKGSGYRLGEKVTVTNDYCIVYVDGAWRFVDPHWGSQYVISSVDNNPDWQVISDETPPNGSKPNDNDESGNSYELGNHCDEFYFLTDPVAMVYTHLTIDPKLQLLARPVTEHEFTGMAYLKDAFFELGMTTVSHPKCLVESDHNGTVVFEFGLDKSRRCQFSAELYKSVQDPALNIVDGEFSLDQFITLENLTDRLRVQIVLPRIGQYKFELNGKEVDSEDSFREICEYSIKCNKPNFRQEPNPENKRGEWGPGADTVRYGLEPVHNDGGIIIAKDGKAQIRLHSKESRRLLFKPKLRSFESPHEDLRESICHYQTPNNNVVFLMKLPHQGKYTLELFAKDINKIDEKDSEKNGAKTDRTWNKEDKNKKNTLKLKKKHGLLTSQVDDDDEEDSSFENICNYLIKSDCGFFDLAPFPDGGFFDLAPYPPLNNHFAQTGDLTPWVDVDNHIKAKDPRLTSTSHTEAVLDPYNEGQLTIHLTADREVDLRPHMIRYYEHEGEQEDCTEYVYLLRNKLSFTVLVKFPKVGFYKMSLLSKDKEGRIIHQYLINAVDPDTTGPPFPVPGDAWRNEIDVIQPRVGQLEADKKVAFKVRAPGAKKVHVQWNNGNNKQDLTSSKKDPSLWEGNVHTDPRGGGELNIVVDNDDSVFTYKVLNGEEIKEIAGERSTADKDVDEHRREMNERRIAEKEEAERQQKEAEDKAKKAEEDFKKNRQQYEREEELLRKKEEEEEKKEMAAEETMSDEQDTVELRSADLRTINVDVAKSPESSREDDQLTTRTVRTNRVNDKEEKPRNTNRDHVGSDTYRTVNEEHDHKSNETLTSRRGMSDNKEDWHRYQEKLTQQMALEKLRESVRNRDHTMLKQAIVECHSFEKLQKNKELGNARKTLQVIEARRDLEAACESKDGLVIRKQVEAMRRAGLTNHLQSEMHEALYLAESMEREPHNRNILDMGKKMMTEIRRYQNPNPVMHRVMQGAFLMLGEDEDTTDSWKQCQRLCNPQGNNGMNRRMFDLQPSKINPEIMARSKEIFSDIDITKVQSVGPGAVTFYVWARHVLEDGESSRRKGQEPAKPASRERQREIFGRQPVEPKKSRLANNKAIMSSNESTKPNRPIRRNFDYDDDDY